MKRTIAAVLAIVLAPVLALHGWGRQGHRIVADVAQERLTEVAKRNVQSLIGNNTLASVRRHVSQLRLRIKEFVLPAHFRENPCSELESQIRP